MTLEQAAERVGRKWQAITTDPEVKGFDFASLIAILIQLLPMLLPLLEMCSPDEEKVIVRARLWANAMDDRQLWWRLRLRERITLRWFLRRSARLIRTGANDIEDLEPIEEELQLALIKAVADATPEEITSVRAA